MNKAQSELKAFVDKIDASPSSNRKSTARALHEKLGKRTGAVQLFSALYKKKYKKYKELFEQYTVMMKDYHR